MDLVTNVVRGSEADRLLLLLHGYGADERDLGGLLAYLDPEGHFVAVLPRGPDRGAARLLLVRHGGRRPPTRRPWPTASPTALAALDDLLDAACDEHGMQRGGGRRRRLLAGRRARARARRSGRPTGPAPPACSR